MLKSNSELIIPKRILYVEDDVIIAMAKSKILENNNYQVTSVSSGEEALKLVQSGKYFDLILMDIDLGKNCLDGTETAKLILAKNNLPIVFLTSHSEKEIVQKVKNITNYGYVLKESGSFVLVQQIESALNLFEANEKIRQSEQRFRAIFNATFQFTGLLTPDGRLIEANQTALDFAGIKHCDIIGKPFWEARWWAGNEFRVKQLQKAIKDAAAGEFIRYEVELQGAGENTIIIDFSLKPILDEFGKVILLIPEGRDVTEHRKAEEALRESQIQYKALVNEMQQGLAVHEIITNSAGEVIDYRFLAANKSYEKLTGLKPEEIVGKTVLEVLPDIEKYWIEKFGQVALTGEPLHYENYVQSLGKYYEVVAYRNQKNQFTVIVTDITELRLDKIKYETIFNSANDSIFLMKDYLFIDCNPKTLEVFKCKKKEDIIGHSPFEFSPKYQPDGRLSEEKALGKINLALSGIPQFFEWTHSPQDGSIIETEVSLNLVQLPAGKYILAIVRDITDRKKLEEQLRIAQKLDSLGILAGGIAHDFNNLLQSIVSNIDMAKIQAEKNSPIIPYLDRALSGFDKASSLTNQLLTYAKGGQPKKELIQLKDLILNWVEFSTSGSNVTFQVNVQPDLWPIEADSGQLNQVISNLIINAKQAMPNGGQLTITINNLQVQQNLPSFLKPGNYILISVADQGAGISQENLNKIFDPYFSTKSKGSGLGLTTAFSIIKNHGGLIFAESEIAKGTTFKIYLPAIPDATPALTNTEKTAERKSSGRVLIMDDSQEIIDTTRKMLEYLGFQVASAAEGQKAVELYREAKEQGTPFRFLILDLTVQGGMGGKEAIQRIKEFDPDAIALVASGYSNDPILTEPEKFGFSGRLGKPYMFEDLKKVIQKILPQNENPENKEAD